jgi:hypothetical protein
MSSTRAHLLLLLLPVYLCCSCQRAAQLTCTPPHELRPFGWPRGGHRLFLGCHSDTGYAQQSRGLFSQLVMDESFESEQHTAQPPPCYPSRSKKGCKNGNGISWVQIVPNDAQASLALDPTLSMNGFKSMRIAVTKGRAAIANRGNGNAGLFIEPAREYEGYFFAATAGATVRASLYDRDTNTSLGATTIKLAPGSNFTQVNFSLTTTAGAGCTEVIRCSGEFRLEVVGPGTVNFDFVFLQ